MAEARWFVRTAAVLVGLANLVVLAHLFGGNPALPTGVSWTEVSVPRVAPYVLAAVAAGLVAAEAEIRWLDGLSYPRAGVVGAVCLGGALMGFLFSAVLVLRTSDSVGLGLTFAGFGGVLFEAVLGAVEGLLLAPPLVATLGRLGNGVPSSRTMT
ncbi:hypothetical protein GBA65_09045 [Rubrobacter marinus]|uniref:Uncharacterized protein n=1 Tax=Rubrobacter marinus TaxID=2653852 RepID=A0A6G8PWQ6_9ACTN|nr:hypothetical protein [Rubrobacter marinus]QIN78644.1 hypothetical protein GBA65_09045 [Rubrobacter marinus]